MNYDQLIVEFNNHFAAGNPAQMDTSENRVYAALQDILQGEHVVGFGRLLLETFPDLLDEDRDMRIHAHQELILVPDADLLAALNTFGAPDLASLTSDVRRVASILMGSLRLGEEIHLEGYGAWATSKMAAYNDNGVLFPAKKYPIFIRDTSFYRLPNPFDVAFDQLVFPHPGDTVNGVRQYQAKVNGGWAVPYKPSLRRPPALPSFTAAEFNAAVAALGQGVQAWSKPFPVYFTFEHDLPTITKIQPAQIPVDERRDTIVTITGTNFINGETIVYCEQRIGELIGFGNIRKKVRTELLTRFISAMQMDVIIPAYLRNTVRKNTLIVFNGTYGSKTILLDVAPTPRFLQVQPDPIEANIIGEPNPSDTVVTITGKSLNGTTVLWNQNPTLVLSILPTRNDTVMQVIVPVLQRSNNPPTNPNIRLRDTSGVFSLLVRHSNGLTASVPISVIFPRTAIDSIRPNPIELPELPPAIAYKSNSDVNAGQNGQNENLPVFAGLPNTVELFPNAPNPFESQTRLEYALPNDATLSIEVYDSFGRRAEELVPQKFHKAGFYGVMWNAERATSSGIYTAVLQSMDAKGNMTRKTIRMTLIR
jgi:hypothetical protein